MSDNNYYGWVTAGFTTIVGAIAVLYKDWKGKAQTDATLRSTEVQTSNDIIDRLRQENDDLKKANRDLLNINKEQHQSNAELIINNEKYFTRISELEKQVKELNLKVTKLLAKKA